MEKKEARAEVQRRVARLTGPERAEKSARAFRLLSELPEFRAARTVLLFVSIPDEIDTLPIIRRALANGKTVVLPRCEMKTHRLLLYSISSVERDLVPGPYGIPEPTGNMAVPPAQIDFVLVPARAYDGHGNRLGRGAGFYDRFLADPALKATPCGIAYEEQVLPHVPHDPHDLPVRIIVTDREVRRIPDR
jgi:5-formyltetrahydrofolate cyclo-ligase